MPSRCVRASFTDSSIRVYQAYPAEIAERAVNAGRLVPPFKRDRMTWIKPSFLWMMYRSGWATKLGQERVLAIEVSREGFEWALAHASLSHFDPDVHRDHDDWLAQKELSPVRVQWDPDRSVTLSPLDRRAIQVGLGGESVSRYVDDWTVSITDITPAVSRVLGHLNRGDLDSARADLPAEHSYPLPDAIAARIGASQEVHGTASYPAPNDRGNRT